MKKIVWLVILCSFTLAGCGMEEGLVYFPTRTLEATPSAAGLPFEEVGIETEDGVRLAGWWVGAPQSKPSEAVTVLVLHGNAGNISHRLDFAKGFFDLGWNTLLLDYRGYGKSEGRPGEEGLYRDGRAAYRYLTENRKVAPGSLVLYGESVGCAVAFELAHSHKVRAIVAQSPFTSITEMMLTHYLFLMPLRFLIRARFDSLAKVSALSCPCLFIHGTEDEIVPFEMGEKLYRRYGSRKEFYPVRGAHHNDLVATAGPALFEKIRQFVSQN